MNKTTFKTLFTFLLLGGATALGAATVKAHVDASLQTAAVVEARTGTTTGIKADIKNIRQTAEDKIKALRGEAREEVKGKVVEMVNRKIDNRFDKMNKRFQATIERLTNIMTRVKTRIEKVKNAGGNTTASEKFVADAQLSLDLAKANLASLKVTSETTVTLENASTTRAQAKTAMENMRKMAKELEKNLQNTRVSLSKAVGSLKGQSQVHATSTTQTTI